MTIRIPYKFQIHPGIKLLLFLGINIGTFSPEFFPWRWILFVIEVLLVFWTRMPWARFSGIGKVILVNFLGLYLIFYFALFNWWEALLQFGSFALTLVIMILASFLFIHTTPPIELVSFLRRIKIPTKIVYASVISISWLPMLSQELRHIIVYQQARGYKISLFRIGPIIIPAILHVMDLAMNLSISMESRGFH